jgi:hypothetical protein
MSGAIGLTSAGKLLDKHLTLHQYTYTPYIHKFINKFTSKARSVHATLLTCHDITVKEFVLNILEKHYIDSIESNLKNRIDTYSYTLMKNYVHALTRVGFTPTTKTQQSLMRAKSVKQTI